MSTPYSVKLSYLNTRVGELYRFLMVGAPIPHLRLHLSTIRKYFILDEPAVGLDPLLRKNL